MHVSPEHLSSIPLRSAMIVAGDPSGDNHAAAIIRQLNATSPGITTYGIGGHAMQREGFEAMLPFEPFNRMGFLEVVLHLPFFLSAKKRLVQEMKIRKPGVLLCVDYPGLNMLLLKEAAKLSIPVIWYIAPMVWAWKKKRAATLGQLASHIGVIFPFEVDHFKPYRAPVSFVGNPIVEAMEHERVSCKSDFARGPKMHLALVPGSRRQEIERMLVPMVRAYSLLKQTYPGLRATLSHFGNLAPELYHKALGGTDIELFSGPLRELLARSDMAIVKSGTSTLEAALMGVPMIVAYRTSAVTYAIFKKLADVRFIGLPNIIAGEPIVPECIQDNMNSENLAAKVTQFIENPEIHQTTSRNLASLRERLGSSKPSVEIARLIRGFCTVQTAC